MSSQINGLLLVNKPLGPSSNFVLQQIKRLFGVKKAGHTGSLDPLATGMLPICFGEATKYSQFLLDADKEYTVKGCLGITTTTGDAEGEVVSKKQISISISDREWGSVLNQFKGKIQQLPPMYSALKHNGKKYYELARAGVDIKRKARLVDIKYLELLSIALPYFELRVRCSKGTYIRTLIEDIGEALGYGAYTVDLHRVSVSPFYKEKMWGIEELRDSNMPLSTRVLPMDSILIELPQVTLSKSNCVALKNGLQVDRACDEDIGFGLTGAESGQFFRLYDEQIKAFWGVVELVGRESFKAVRMVNLIKCEV